MAAASPKAAVALGARLRSCRNVITLGVRTNFDDYPPDEAQMILSAEKIYYPSAFYADLLDAMGKPIFPSCHNYKFAQDKIKQTALFRMLGIPHPYTLVYHGRRHRRERAEALSYPFIAKVPRGSAMGLGVFLIRNLDDLDRYLAAWEGPAYFQAYLPIDRDIRVVVIGKKAAHAYWRVAADGEYRTNVARGGRISLAPVPAPAVALAEETARRCGWNDVGIDICRHEDRYYVLEANMKYGREGFRAAGLDYILLMERLIENGDI